MSGFISKDHRPEPEFSQRVKVHRNLNVKGAPVYSIVALSGEHKNKVVGYAPSVELADVELKVSAASHRRVIREGVRNVHSWAVGNYMGSFVEPPSDFAHAIEVVYQPFVRPWFCQASTPSEKIWRLDRACTFGAVLLALEA